MEDNQKKWTIEDDLNFLKMEDNLFFLLEDNLNCLENGRRPHFVLNGKQPYFFLIEDDLGCDIIVN